MMIVVVIAVLVEENEEEESYGDDWTDRFDSKFGGNITM